MHLFKKVSDLQYYLRSLKAAGKTIGFVPTMGALHQGHVSLIEASKAECDHTVCSIFVNPTQFNDQKDLDKYPRTPGADIELLLACGCDILFMPPVAEVYPPEGLKALDLDFGSLETVMEGEFRPGHFKGVAQVVHRLLEIVLPDRLYMGQKDYQQVAIVRSMIRQTGLQVALITCPTLREADGLAMSSRNLRLSPAARQEATLIFRTLSYARAQAGKLAPAEIQAAAFQQLSAPGFRPEYFDLVDGDTLQPVRSFEESAVVVACTAVWLDGVRLIDNMILKAPE
jgi:pantoate--beta-alanine ligase